jgi:hypothetical protein
MEIIIAVGLVVATLVVAVLWNYRGRDRNTGQEGGADKPR